MFAGDLHRERVAVLVSRAVARGELPPGCDTNLAADLVAAPLYWRLVVMREPFNSADHERLSAAIVAGMRAGCR